ncbi:MAG: NUDIX hydrolase [Desulfitobacteriia bacterium]|jgi:8-oxo-dGTP diphosphatase
MPFYRVQFNFCPVCATKLENIFLGGGLRKKCPQCNFIHWGNYALGVGGVVLQENKCLLVQRAHNPGKGKWTIPGGYVNADEKIEEAITREVKEETGVIAEPLSVLAVRDRPEDNPSRRHDIYIVFLLQYLKGEIKPDPFEVLDCGFFTLEECKRLDISSQSYHSFLMALKYVQNGNPRPGLVRKQGLQLFGAQTEFYSLP